METSTPTLPLIPVGPDDVSHRLGNVRERLRVISTKHKRLLRSKSVEALADVLASAGQIVAAAKPPSALEAFTPLPSSTSTIASPVGSTISTATTTTSESQAHAASLLAVWATLRAAEPPVALAASPSCACATIAASSADDPSLCNLCHAPINQLRELMHLKLDAVNSLLITLAQMDDAADNDRKQADEAALLLKRVEDLSVLIDSYSEEADRHEGDLVVLNEKVKEELTRSSDLERDKESLQAELDELTTSLFEEANNLVQNETQQRHLLEEREKVLEMELNETREILKREQVQLRELKIKMEKEYSSVLAADVVAINSKLQPIDEMLFAEFRDFVVAVPATKLAKLPSQSFLKNLIEDDILPTLRFGGNPRTSTRKLLDAISSDLVTVQEMNPVQFGNWLATNQAIKDAVTVRTQAVNDAKAAFVATATTDSTSPTAPSSIPYIPSSLTRSRNNSEVPQTPYPTIPAETTAAITVIASISVTPSHNVFQKSMVERVSAWGSATSVTVSATTTTASGSSTSDPKSTDPLTSFPAFFVLNGCSTCGKHAPLQHHFKIADPTTINSNQADSTAPQSSTAVPAVTSINEGWIPLCENCHFRLDAVTRFYEFLRIVRTGVYATRDVKDMYAEVSAIRRDLFVARVCGGGVRTVRGGGSKRESFSASGGVGRRNGSTGSIFGGSSSFRQMGSTSRLSSEIL
ncbi:UNVERIFIED_CONTAM: hypothetical protein HDU68_010316 [Siphonaria sp. JEL0065]|nr:hypothetical protein HDU68_010316 [Siphonaria sp. JEL0065]